MRARPFHAWVVLLALSRCTCDDPGTVSNAEARVDVEPTLVDLGRLPIGVRGQGVVTIRSVGESPVSLDPPTIEGGEFKIFEDVQRLSLPPGESEALVVEVRPNRLGVIENQLLISSDDQTTPLVIVTLRVEGIEQPPCDDGNECTTNRFDTELGKCVTEFADGTACSPADRCIINAVCQKGVCLGESKVCDDQNFCTRDLCRQIDGECVFLEQEGICDDDNECTADVCLADGCQNEPVANGTACDDGDLCSTGDACLAGICSGLGTREGEACDDGDSCTIGDTCVEGECRGDSIIDATPEGGLIFEYPLTEWPRAFLHRREVSLRDDGVFVGLDHLAIDGPEAGLTHVIFAMSQCGSSPYEFAYRPPDALVQVSAVRREMQVEPDGTLRIVVGVRQLPGNGFAPQTTSYVLDADGDVVLSRVRAAGGETGRSLLPDGSHIYGVTLAVTEGPIIDPPHLSTLSVVRETVSNHVLWTHERTFNYFDNGRFWAEFLAVAGPRVLFWSDGRFGALDFNTGQQVWAKESAFIAKEMALSTSLGLGIARVGERFPSQLLAVEIIEGNEVFLFPPNEDLTYVARTDPVISRDGRIFVLMQHGELMPESDKADPFTGILPTGLEWVELSPSGVPVATTPLPYDFPDGWIPSRHEDFDDPYPTVADDGVAYLGYGNQFWAIDPDGGLRWTYTSTIPNAFTGTVPVLRDDGVLLISEGGRRIIGLRSNGGRMSDEGWASFRHDNRRTNFTP